jgi:hypothetical protein
VVSCASGLKRLGDPTGTTERDWVQAMKRNPVSISALPRGLRLLQWTSGTWVRQRVTVVFGPDHRFVRIQSRYQC